MKLKAFDCTTAYLQTEIDKEMYVRPPPGLMSLLGRNQSDVCKLNKAMYGYPRGVNLWYQKLFKYLKEYGFRPLGSSATFMMLDRGPEGRILMNVYSDDGLASTNNETLWDCQRRIPGSRSRDIGYGFVDFRRPKKGQSTMG